MKNFFLMFCLLLSIKAQAQILHDVKVDVSQWSLLRTANITYEAVLNKHYAVEVGFGHKRDEASVVDYRTSSIPKVYSYKETKGLLLLGGKYYPFSKTSCDRLYIGAAYLGEYLLYRDPEYSTRYIEVFGRSPIIDSRLHSKIGGTFGYKHVFKKGIIAGAGMSYFLDLTYLFDQAYGPTFDLSGIINLFAGYRFGKKAVKAPEN